MDSIRLAGKEFTLLDQQMTAAQQDYLSARFNRAGVTDLFVMPGQKPTEDELVKLRSEFVARILESGQKSFLLAGMLTEVGKKWSRVDADKNAALFDAITDRAEKEIMSESFVVWSMAFFLSAAKSSMTSPSSSITPNAEDQAIASGAVETSGPSPQ